MELRKVAWEGPSRPRVQALRERLEAEGFRVFEWEDAPGAVYPPHSHACDESIWVVRGRITFEAGGRKLYLEPGDRLMLPAGTVHSAVAGPQGAAYLIGQR